MFEPLKFDSDNFSKDYFESLDKNYETLCSFIDDKKSIANTISIFFKRAMHCVEALFSHTKSDLPLWLNNTAVVRILIDETQSVKTLKTTIEVEKIALNTLGRQNLEELEKRVYATSASVCYRLAKVQSMKGDKDLQKLESAIHSEKIASSSVFKIKENPNYENSTPAQLVNQGVNASAGTADETETSLVEAEIPAARIQEWSYLPQEMRDKLIFTARKGSIDDIYNVAEMFAIGEYQDVNEAIQWLELGVEKGDTRAMMSLTHLFHIEGYLQNYPEKTLKQVVKLLQQVVDSGETRIGRPCSTDAMVCLASLYLQGGEGIIKQDKNKAIQLLKNAAGKGNEEAANMLGMLYEMSGDWEAALKLYSQTAEKGNRNSLERLATIHALGLAGLPKNQDLANEYRKKGARDWNADIRRYTWHRYST